MMRTIAHNRSQPSDSSSAAATMSRSTPSRLWNTRFFPMGKEYHTGRKKATHPRVSCLTRSTWNVQPSSTTRVRSHGITFTETVPEFSIYKK